ncbi:hypothetical protein [Neobacillus bataviensis]|uniref:hypothetical protein n=1 Tax=Neobacillus bataviensis TaxID=220685 RepID=UPI001CBDD379|nr:hypothetical protein [Neobacillus bataviensis]
MKNYSSDAIRNIGILGHVKCGKTSITSKVDMLNKRCLNCGTLENMSIYPGLCEGCQFLLIDHTKIPYLPIKNHTNI